MTAPLILSTWSFGRAANEAAWPCLVDRGRSSLDAVEQVCRHCEEDVGNKTVGRGGYPDASGRVSLDASIMLSPAWCGSVAYVRKYVHAVTIARLVMEQTEHVMLAGDGAEALAAEHGMEQGDLLSEGAKKAWEEWKAKRGGEMVANVEERGVGGDSEDPWDPLYSGSEGEGEGTHDTIGALALDCSGVLAGACSTSGLAWKRPGRVGDTPIVGAGLYVDPKHGAAVATGTGELMMGVCATFLAVESMRGGMGPQAAAEAVVRRVAESYEIRDEHQVGIIVLRPGGEWGSAALRPGFRVAVRSERRDEMVEPLHILLPK